MSAPIFQELPATLQTQGVEAAFAQLCQLLREQQRYHELLHARLMELRWRMGLPVIMTSSLEELPEPQRTQFENAYVEICREVGLLILKEGRIREAWMYLRPTGERQAVAAALQQAKVDEEQVEELIDVALHQGVSPRFGFELVLKNYGTCNAISMFDSEMHDRPLAARQEVAGLLVRHLHGELRENLQAEVARQEGRQPAEQSIAALVADRDWLFTEDAYHIDTSHLSAVVRFARLVTDPEVLRLAVDLTEYGRRLSRQYQYAGEEPFVDSYAAHALFFRAQLGEEVEPALAYFRQKAEELSLDEHGTEPAEVYVALLDRLNRSREALDASAQLMPPGVRQSGFAPSLSELASRGGNFSRMQEICQQRDDLLGYAASLIEGRLRQSAQ